jgi:hypothetical protein
MLSFRRGVVEVSAPQRRGAALLGSWYPDISTELDGVIVKDRSVQDCIGIRVTSQTKRNLNLLFCSKPLTCLAITFPSESFFLVVWLVIGLLLFCSVATYFLPEKRHYVEGLFQQRTK